MGVDQTKPSSIEIVTDRHCTRNGAQNIIREGCIPQARVQRERNSGSSVEVGTKACHDGDTSVESGQNQSGAHGAVGRPMGPTMPRVLDPALK